MVTIEVTVDTGSWAPLTKEGTLLVDGFLASCYALYPHELSDRAMSSVKLEPQVLLENEDSQHEDGTRSIIKIIKQLGDRAGLRRKELGGEGPVGHPLCDNCNNNIALPMLQVVVPKIEL